MTAASGLFLPPSASAANPALEQARQAYDRFELEETLVLLEKALEVSIDAREQVEVFELLAILHVTFRRMTDAQKDYEEILRRKPDWRLPPNASPKIVAVFERAVAAIEEEKRSLATETAPPTKDEAVTTINPGSNPTRARGLPMKPDQARDGGSGSQLGSSLRLAQVLSLGPLPIATHLTPIMALT